MVNNAQKTELVFASHNRIPSKIAGIGPIVIQIAGIGATLLKAIRTMYMYQLLANYYPVKTCIKEFCSVIYLISLTTLLISTYQS